jgi:hypothetical protein
MLLIQTNKTKDALTPEIFFMVDDNGLALGEEGDFTHQTSKYLVASKLAQILY